MRTGIGHVPLQPGSPPENCLLIEPVARRREGAALRREVSHCHSCGAATLERGKVHSKDRVLAPNNSTDCVKTRARGDLSLRACADWHGSGARVLCRRAILASSGNAIRDFGVFTQPLAGADRASCGAIGNQCPCKNPRAPQAISVPGIVGSRASYHDVSSRCLHTSMLHSPDDPESRFPKARACAPRAHGRSSR